MTLKQYNVMENKRRERARDREEGFIIHSRAPFLPTLMIQFTRDFKLRFRGISPRTAYITI